MELAGDFIVDPVEKKLCANLAKPTSSKISPNTLQQLNKSSETVDHLQQKIYTTVASSTTPCRCTARTDTCFS
jgi:hypothetical protein